MITTIYRGLSREPRDLLFAARAALIAAEHQAEELTASTRRRLARTACKVRRRARAVGFAAGQRVGAARLAQLFDGEAAYRAAIASAHRDCLELAVSIAAEIAAVDLAPNPEVLARRVERGLAHILDQRRVRIFVAPVDIETIRKALERRLSGRPFELAPDSALTQGDAVIETPSGSLPLLWREHLDLIRERLFSEFDSTAHSRKQAPHEPC